MKSLQTVCLLFATASLVAAQQYTISTIAGIPGAAGLYPPVVPVGQTPPTTPTLATAGQLYQPSTVAVDPNGNYYIADYFTYVVRMVTASTGDISLIAGDGIYGFAGDGNGATTAELSDVHGLAADSNGNVYISDTSNSRIREIVASTGDIRTFAGNGTRGYSGDGSIATSAEIWSPAALVLDGSGNLYVADYGNSTVRKITPGANGAIGTISTVAGTGTWGYSGDGGPASKAALAFPVSLAVDSAGNLYIGDVGNNTIRKVDTSGNISTVVTNVTPHGFAIDSAGNFYFVDGVSSTVKKVLPGGIIVTIAGNGAPGYGGDGYFNGTTYAGGQASLAQVNKPASLAMGPGGAIYFADTGNDIIRQLVAVPSSVGVQDTASEVPGSMLLPGAIAPGEILTLFGSGLGPSSLTMFTQGANGLFPTQIAGTSVTFNGTPAPLIYTSSGLVAAIAPYEINNSATAAIVVTYQGNTFTCSMPVTAVAPSVFTANASGSGQAAAINDADGTYNSAANPAHLGSYVTLYATGTGYTTNPVDGQPASTTCGSACLPTPQLAVTVKIGNQTVIPSYAGGAPSLVAGVTQVNFQIPATILPGPVLVQVFVNGYPSQAAVTVAVAQ